MRLQPLLLLWRLPWPPALLPAAACHCWPPPLTASKAQSNKDNTATHVTRDGNSLARLNAHPHTALSMQGSSHNCTRRPACARLAVSATGNRRCICSCSGAMQGSNGMAVAHRWSQTVSAHTRLRTWLLLLLLEALTARRPWATGACTHERTHSCQHSSTQLLAAFAGQSSLSAVCHTGVKPHVVAQLAAMAG